MHSLALLLGTAAALAPSALAQPTRLLTERGTPVCTNTDTTAGPFLLSADEWGASQGTGNQCNTLTSQSGNSIAWSTNWTWSGGPPGTVHTYTNANLNTLKTSPQKPISSYTSIPTTWQWNYSPTTGIAADVIYDAFLGPTTNVDEEAIEVAIFVGNYGDIKAISSTGDTPLAANVQIGGLGYNLFKGANPAGGTAYSFMALTPNNQNFNGDLMDFFKYLIQSQGLPGSSYLHYIGAGTEAFTGTGATFTTTGYSISAS